LSRTPRGPAARQSNPCCIALLRAVNVGGRTIKMDQLKRVFESMSLANVQTFIASGNVIFETALGSTGEIETLIESGLQKAFKYPIPTFVRTAAEMIAAAEQAPYTAGDLETAGLYVTFLKAAPDAGMTRKLLAMRTRDDDFAVIGREVYWLRRRIKERLGEPFPAMEKALPIPGTMRSITTVRKIAAKYCSVPGQSGQDGQVGQSGRKTKK
jgi:uncharacterized protein (DUF1697 family)